MTLLLFVLAGGHESLFLFAVSCLCSLGTLGAAVVAAGDADGPSAVGNSCIAVEVLVAG